VSKKRETKAEAETPELRVASERTGQLSGEFPHDFNNLLTIIMMSLEVAGRDAQACGCSQRPITNAMRAAQGLDALTRRLSERQTRANRKKATK